MRNQRARPLPDGTGDDAVIFIPRDKRGGPRHKRVERAVRWLWSRGIYPGPAAVSLRLHGHANRTINGVETSIRNRLLAELGISRQRKHAQTPWELPASAFTSANDYIDAAIDQILDLEEG